MAFNKLSIIVPVYNEQATVSILLERLFRLILPQGIEKEIIVVDDGSSDGTMDILHDLAVRPPNGRTYRLVLLRHKTNQGKGMAIRTGLVRATGNYIVIQDADLEYNPNNLVRMVEKVQETGAEAIFGSRRLSAPNQEQGRWYYYLGGVYLTWLANLLYGTKITDEPTCYKMIKTDLLRSLNLTCTGFEFCPEVVSKLGRNKVKIVEIPISYHPRGTKEGKKIRFKDALIATWILVRNRF